MSNLRFRRLCMTCRTAAPAIVLFSFMLAHALLETARDALFLSRLGPERLAWAYLAIAGTALGAVATVRGWLKARDSRRILIGLLVGASIGTGVLAVTLARAPSLVFVLYVWTGLVATLVVPSFWVMVERAVIVSDAKRTFATIAAGGGLGALVGSGISAGLGALFVPEVLVGLAAVVLGISAAVTAYLAPRALEALPRPEEPHAPAGATLRAHRYVRLLLLLGLVSTIAVTLGDLMFKRILAEAYTPGSDLTVTLGAIYTLLNVIALVVQIGVTPRLLERLGVGGALTVLPVVLLATSVGFLATGAVLAVVAMRIGDGSLRHSVNRVASEILFMPLAPAVRDAAKPVVDVVAQRGGQVIAALLSFSIAGDSFGTWQLGLMLAILVAIWLAVVAVTRMAYVQQFRDTLAAGEIQRDARIPTLDGSAVQLLTASLSSPDESEALAALELLARRGDRIPALVLYHPSAAIVRRALAALDRDVRPDVARVLGHLTTHPDPQIRAAALAASSRTGRHAERLRASLVDPEPDVRAAAAIGLAAATGEQAGDAHAVMSALLHGTAEERAAVARAIAHRPHASHRPLLDQLAASREPAVIREVLRVWEAAPELTDAERLLGLLEDPHVRGDARRVFSAGGQRLLEKAIEALDDARTPLGVRRHLPRTISRFRSPRAAQALVARLLREPDGMTEFKILRALGRMRADDPRIPIETAPVRTYVLRSIGDARRYMRLGDRLRQERAKPTPTTELLADLLSEKRRYALERVFRALGILHPRAGMLSVHDAITSTDDERIGAAIEIVDGLVDAELRIPLVELVEAQHAPAEPVPLTYEELLGALLVDPSDTLRCIAAHHVAERRLVAMRDELVRLRPRAASDLVVSAFDQALARLDA